LYHVLVCDDVTCRINYETGPETLQRLSDLARSKPVVTEELCIKIVEWVADRFPDHALGVDVNHGGQDLPDGQSCRLRSRIGLCETGRGRHDHQERRDRADSTLFQRHTRSK